MASGYGKNFNFTPYNVNKFSKPSPTHPQYLNYIRAKLEADNDERKTINKLSQVKGNKKEDVIDAVNYEREYSSGTYAQRKRLEKDTVRQNNYYKVFNVHKETEEQFIDRMLSK